MKEKEITKQMSLIKSKIDKVKEIINTKEFIVPSFVEGIDSDIPNSFLNQSNKDENSIDDEMLPPKNTVKVIAIRDTMIYTNISDKIPSKIHVRQNTFGVMSQKRFNL